MVMDHEDDGLTGVEESRFITDRGMVLVRFDGDEMFLGLSAQSDPEADPDVVIQLTRRQAASLSAELRYWLDPSQADPTE